MWAWQVRVQGMGSESQLWVVGRGKQFWPFMWPCAKEVPNITAGAGKTQNLSEGAILGSPLPGTSM